MIDLRRPALPDCLMVDGERLPIYTGFRTWIAVDAAVNDDGVVPGFIFKGAAPEGAAWVQPALDFLTNENETPRKGGAASERAVDFVADGEYITAAFQGAYGIDLTDPALEMHWHRFMALFRGLPQSAVMSQIMGYRTWRKDSRDADKVMRELKAAWALPDKAAERDKDAVLKLFNERYG